jgi:hypothetical protein
MMNVTTSASESDLFRVLQGVALHANLKRTLAHCLFWMQHATHQNNGMPMIWKTGPELENELSINARTANRHLKDLAKHGYWSLTYRPKPGTIGKVTWLTATPAAARIVLLARELGGRRNQTRRDPVQRRTEHPAGPKPYSKMSHHVTAKQNTQTEQTAESTAKFLLSGSEKKQALLSLSKLPGYGPIPPNYLEVDEQVRSLALVADSSFKERGLITWNWSSPYTWAHISEVAGKLGSHGLCSNADYEEFLQWLLDHWAEIRGVMNSPYSGHNANIHAPSPMALAHEFDRLFAAYLDSKAPKPLPKFSSFDEGF